jgi:hypothetical protein
VRVFSAFDGFACSVAGPCSVLLMAAERGWSIFVPTCVAPGGMRVSGGDQTLRLASRAFEPTPQENCRKLCRLVAFLHPDLAADGQSVAA